MEKVVKYWIFRTKWGYFGIAGTKDSLLRTLLPQAKRVDIKRQILKTFPSARSEKKPFKGVAKAVLEYFGGKKVDFRNAKVVLDSLSPFARKVLATCRTVGFGKVLSYSKLAKKAGQPKGARAAGTAMAKNPLPLIIPCHRVIRSDGKLGGFSAPGGVNTKKKLIDLEHKR